MSRRFDSAVVGAGILGLAHAYHLAKQGKRVVVFERHPKAMGASVRNFGMIWPIGQPAGARHQLALRSREIWGEVLADAGIWHEACGSLHLAYHDDEAQVLREFAERAESNGFDVSLLSPAEVAAKSPLVRLNGLQMAMWSATEACVDPRDVIASLPAYLAHQFGVRFEFNCGVTAIDLPDLVAGGQTWQANQVFVCSGDEMQMLYPEVFQGTGMTRCKLQMMRTAPLSREQRIGAHLAAGLTLRHYTSFQNCPTLPELSARYDREMPDYGRYGIHVMASQNGHGELTLGDSHEYDDAIEPFDKAIIDRLVLDYLQTFLDCSDLTVTSRWQGIYLKHPSEPFFIAHPAPHVTLVTGIGGAGMTLSFGVAERTTTASAAP
jgi:D-hydroxyproline dehydrogenase subunit beta